VANCAGVNYTSTACETNTCNPLTGQCVIAAEQPTNTTECNAGGGPGTGTCSIGECVSKCANAACAIRNNFCGKWICQATTGNCVAPQPKSDGTACPYVQGQPNSGRCLGGRCASVTCYNNCPAQTECTTYTCDSVTQTCIDAANQRLCTVGQWGTCGAAPSYTCQAITYQRLTAFTPTAVRSSSNGGASWADTAPTGVGQSQGTWAGRNIAASADGTKLIAARTGGRIWRSDDRCEPQCTRCMQDSRMHRDACVRGASLDLSGLCDLCHSSAAHCA
jgi:hypothetical protein